MITIEEVKSFLNIQDNLNDDFIRGCIDKAVGEINILTNRRLDHAEYKEYYSGNGKDELFMKNFPAETIAAMKIFNKNGTYTFDEFFDGTDTIENSTALLEMTGKLILKKGYVFTENYLIEIIYTAGYKENGLGYFKTPYDLQNVLVKMAAKHFLDSSKGESLFLKRGTGIGGAATSGTLYTKLDVTPIIKKYRRMNI
jgi:hypothetical protein